MLNNIYIHFFFTNLSPFFSLSVFPISIETSRRREEWIVFHCKKIELILYKLGSKYILHKEKKIQEKEKNTN